MIDLRFEVKNLGAVRDGTFRQKPLTIFCGPNNRGKTWVMYSLYHYHKWLQVWREKGKERGTEPKTPPPPTLERLNRRVSQTLSDLFNTEHESMRDAEFHLMKESRPQFRKLIDSATDANVFLMPAERSGLHLFFRELSARRTALLHHASKENIDLKELLRDVIRSRYALPIAEYIDWLNSLTEKQRGADGHFHTLAERLKRKLAGGAYRVERRTGDITFKPYQSKHDGHAIPRMRLHMTSSSVKSLLGLWFYLENQAKPGDLLMIDEPELNIHPAYQREIARLLARLVNAGLNVVISTHSDYIVREFNTMIMLNRDRDGTMRSKYRYEHDGKKHKYEKEEILKMDQVSACLFDNQTIEAFDISPGDGIYAKTFDDVIRDLNEVNDGVYYHLQEQEISREEGDD